MKESMFPFLCENKCGTRFKTFTTLKSHHKNRRCPTTIKDSDDIEIEIKEGCKIKMSEVGNFLISHENMAVYQG